MAENPPEPAPPTVEDLMGEYSSPASDPPATWTWEIKRPPKVEVKPEPAPPSS